MRRIALAICLFTLSISAPALAQQKSWNDPAFRTFTLSNPVMNAMPDEATAIPQQKIPLAIQTEKAKPYVPPDPEDIPEVLMQEMNSVEKQCEGNAFFSSFHDCRCIAIKFLDARMTTSPDRSRDAIYESVTNQCPNEPGAAGYIFKGCVDVMRFSRPDDFDKFCTCAANKVAADYKKRPDMNMRYIDDLRKTAFVSCGIDNTMPSGQ